MRMFEDTDLPRLAVSWQRHLQAANRSPKTIRIYFDTVRQLVASCAEHDRPTDPADIVAEHPRTPGITGDDAYGPPRR